MIRRFFTTETVQFAGDYYRVNEMQALPICVQRPNPQILVGAGGPRMLISPDEPQTSLEYMRPWTATELTERRSPT